MQHVNWDYRPTLIDPIAFVAYSGWNDGGESAYSAVEHLIDVLGAEQVRTESSRLFAATRRLQDDGNVATEDAGGLCNRCGLHRAEQAHAPRTDSEKSVGFHEITSVATLA